jgi:atypical dual specificity phosphatase
MISALHKLSAYPTLMYNVFLEYVGLKQWYTRIDDHCVLGAMPMQRNYKHIIEKENIKAILTLNKDHELELSIPKSEWKSLNIDFLQIGIEDYIGLPELSQIQTGVSFIKKHRDQNQTVYVHCKAGRYRSAFFVACYLINTRKMKPKEAIEFIKELRPNVILHRESQLIALEAYYTHIFDLEKK